MFTPDDTVDLWLRTAFLGPIALFWVVFNVRLVGARSFSKMTAFDFVITVAAGSLLASAATVQNWAPFVQALGGITTLLALQYLISKIRFNFPKARTAISNEAKLLFAQGRFLESNMAEARVTKEDIFGKMREANALNVADVSAVILETTGDISVLHGGKPDEEIQIGND